MASEAEVANTHETTGEWSTETALLGGHDSSCMSTVSSNDVSGEYSFNFTDVTGTIDGIEVLIHGICGDTNDFFRISLIDSTSTWVYKETTAPGSGSACTDAVDRTVGGAADLWGGTWTAAWITSTSFRLKVTARASGKSGSLWYADHVTVTVHYTEAAPVTEEVILISMS